MEKDERSTSAAVSDWWLRGSGSWLRVVSSFSAELQRGTGGELAAFLPAGTNTPAANLRAGGGSAAAHFEEQVFFIMRGRYLLTSSHICTCIPRLAAISCSECSRSGEAASASQSAPQRVCPSARERGQHASSPLNKVLFKHLSSTF